MQKEDRIDLNGMKVFPFRSSSEPRYCRMNNVRNVG